MTNEYVKEANDFLRACNATMKIEFVGLAINKEWKENVKRNLYQVTLTTPKGSMVFDFWDSIYNTEIMSMNLETYAEKRFKICFDDLKPVEKNLARKELNTKKEKAILTAYDVLACLTKYDPGTFEDFCFEYGYDEDSRSAERIYFAVQKEYSQLTKIFTEEQMARLRDIN